MNSNIKIKPFLKWARGKSQLLPHIRDFFPSDIKNADTYIEPFVGGGAVLFHILDNYHGIKNIVINDINPRLINTYVILRENPLDLVSILEKLQRQYWKLSPEEQQQLYLEQREYFNSGGAERTELAALFIFLNKTCFNGLYRVNKSGMFNVSFGQYHKPLICNRELILRLSKLLKKVTILNSDYAHTIANFRGNTFVYFDPPYRPVSQTSDFTTYSSEGFDEIQQKRLACFCRLLDFNSKWMLSNSCPTEDNFFNEHYSTYKIRQIEARRSIGANSASRGKIRELLITNY